MKEQHDFGRLSETELEVMGEIWQMPAPVTVSCVLEIFAARRGWKTSTLSTILDRLIDKGYLTKTMQGKTNYYSPTLTASGYKERETRTFLDSMYHGSVKNFVAALADSGDMTEEEVAEIRAWFLAKAGDGQ